MAVFFEKLQRLSAASHRETGGLYNRGDSWTGDVRQQRFTYGKCGAAPAYARVEWGRWRAFRLDHQSGSS